MEGLTVERQNYTLGILVLRHDLESMRKKHLDQNHSQYGEEGETDSQCSEKDL